MKKSVSLLLFLLFMAGIALPSQIDGTWQDISYGIDETDMRAVALVPRNPEIIYAGSSKSIFKSADAGKTWQKVYLVRGTKTSVNAIATALDNPEIVYAATQNGLFKSNDGGTVWARAFDRESDVRHLIISEKTGRIYIGTSNGMFISDDSGNTWNKLTGDVSDQPINFLAADPAEPNTVYCAAATGVFKSNDSGQTWGRIFTALAQTSESEPDDSSDEENSDTDDTASTKVPNCIAAARRALFVGTDCGVFVSRDSGNTWDKITGAGLISRKITYLLCINDGVLYAATNSGFFRIKKPYERWEELYSGLASKDIRWLAYSPQKNLIFAATKKGLYKIQPNNTDIGAAEQDAEMSKLLSAFNAEPTIQEIQQATIKYAEVNKEKIDGWSRAAKTKAVLPTLSVNTGRYLTDYYHWDAGPNPDVLQKGRDAIDWSVTASWDLGGLIWNDDQTSIDTRSRLMVQLRDDILDEVTRLYFERRKLQMELLINPPKGLNEKLGKELRLQELTAGIDALTGGYLSKKITEPNEGHL